MLYYDLLKNESGLDAQMNRMIVADRFHIRVWVNTKKFDIAWAEEDNYLSERDEQYQKALTFLNMDTVERHKKYGPFMMPSAKINVRGECRIHDGRHRFCILRDQGAVKIPLSMTRESSKNAEKFGVNI